MTNELQPTHDKNGYYIPYIDSLPLGWYLFYQLTGLIPFDIRYFILHPRAWKHVPYGIYYRICRHWTRNAHDQR